MARKGRDNPRHKHGLFTGYFEYRYGDGDKRPITLAGSKPRRILRGDKREHVVDSIAALLKTFKLTPFEHEAACLHGLRSGFCLEGHRWPLANLEAEQIVAEALRQIGAERPAWEAGQREYTVPPENCRWCARPLPEGAWDGGINKFFCSAECARSALQHRDFKDGKQNDAVARSACRLVASEKVSARTCEHCGKTFHTERERAARFCSKRCRDASWRLDIPERVCGHCGKVFKPESYNPGAQFCGVACRVAARRTRLERACEHCGTMFAPQKQSRRFCSIKCAASGRTVVEFALSCAVCGSAFTSSDAKAMYCDATCKRFVDRLRGGRVLTITPRVFDYVMRPPASGFACEAVAAE